MTASIRESIVVAGLAFILPGAGVGCSGETGLQPQPSAQSNVATRALDAAPFWKALSAKERNQEGLQNVVQQTPTHRAVRSVLDHFASDAERCVVVEGVHIDLWSGKGGTWDEVLTLSILVIFERDGELWCVTNMLWEQGAQFADFLNNLRFLDGVVVHRWMKKTQKGFPRDQWEAGWDERRLKALRRFRGVSTPDRKGRPPEFRDDVDDAQVYWITVRADQGGMDVRMEYEDLAMVFLTWNALVIGVKRDVPPREEEEK